MKQFSLKEVQLQAMYVVLLIFTGNSTLTYQLFPFTNAKYTYVSIVRVTFYTFQVELP